jgi:hypothetical protein
VLYFYQRICLQIGLSEYCHLMIYYHDEAVLKKSTTIAEVFDLDKLFIVIYCLLLLYAIYLNSNEI